MVYNPSLNINAAPSSWWNWGASATNAGTPAFNPAGGSIFTPTNVGNIFTTPIGGVSNPQSPTGLMTQGGVLVGSNSKLDSILNSVLASFAIFKGATHIPTQIPVSNGYDYGNTQAISDPRVLAALYGNQGSTGANIENWAKDNWIVLAVGGVVLMAYLAKSPRR